MKLVGKRTSLRAAVIVGSLAFTIILVQAVRGKVPALAPVGALIGGGIALYGRLLAGDKL